MARALSIHVGVNRPHGRHGDQPLRHSETTAWRMAELASQAGYDSLLVLRGHEATRQAVHRALTDAAGVLQPGGTLLVSFSGHGCQQPDTAEDLDERCGIDQGWCLADGILLDDRLAGYWRLFEAGVRIVVVSESCYSGGMAREDDEEYWDEPVHPRPGWRDRAPVYRDDAPVDYARSCIGEPPRESLGIHASVLLLTASREEQVAREGLFSEHLLAVWNNGAFQESYCALHRAVRERVMTKGTGQEPQILMLGSGDPGFPLEPAFHLQRRGSGRGGIVYR